MKEMNIWILTAYDQPRGMSSRSYDFSKQLVKNGHNVTLFTNSYCHWTKKELLGKGEKFRIEMIDGIRVVWLKTIPYTGNGITRALNMLSNMGRSIQVAKKLSDQPDVILGPSVPLGTGWAAYYLSKVKKAAFVFEVRDVWPICLVYDGSLSKRNPLYYIFRFMEKRMYKKSHRISSVLSNLGKHLVCSGVDINKFDWIPNGLHISKPHKGLTYRSYSSHKKLKVMYVGSFAFANSIGTIIDAAQILDKKCNEQFEFVFVGDGISKKNCIDKVDMIGLRNIRFHDPVLKSDIPSILAEADILIASVLDSKAYSFGINLNKIYDYLAAAKPIILAVNTVDDPVTKSGAGINIPPENPEEMVKALVKLYNLTPDERTSMGERGYDYLCREHDIVKLAKKMEDCFFSSINEKEKVL